MNSNMSSWLFKGERSQADFTGRGQGARQLWIFLDVSEQKSLACKYWDLFQHSLWAIKAAEITQLSCLSVSHW